MLAAFRATLLIFLAPLLVSGVGPSATPAASAGQAPLDPGKGNVICLLGNALAERMQHDGWLETRIQQRFPERELRVRNLGFGGDAIDVHQRTMNFGKFTADGMEMNLANERFVPWDRYLAHCGADVVLAFFGYNESFAGESGLAAFRASLKEFIGHVRGETYAGHAPELVLLGSIPHEGPRGRGLPQGLQRNGRIQLYNRAMAEVAAEAGVRYIDLYAPMLAAYGVAEGPLTINGAHLNEEGNRYLARAIDAALFGASSQTSVGQPARDGLRVAIQEKNLLWFERYRATDGYNVYGGRSRKVYASDGDGGVFSNWAVLQREMDHLDVLVGNRDQAIWQLARGGRPVLDDSNAPPLIEVATNARGDEDGGMHRFLEAQSSRALVTAAPGMRVDVFADEQQFPELANPVQMAWDVRGRLWVAVWPTYPHWVPGEPRNDKLLILEDEDGDGRADTCKTFAGDLHNPTGFEFWNGGVLLAAAPDLLFLEDTDGDDRVDRRERLLHGLSSADTHHSANSFVLGPDGALYFQEGTFHQSQVESIYGPVRNRDGCVWRFHPRSWRVERYIPYGFANPHGHVFDRWGQDFMTDGTGNVNYYALPFSGALPEPLKHRGYFPFFQQRSRPSAGTEILSSGHFPEENQQSYLIANVIGFQGIFQYRITDDGAGFGAVELEPIVQSEERNFRPADIEVGPDGALYFLDWHNPLIGHLQHHLRDPSRDGSHGRVYRVTCAGRDLLTPPAIAGEPIESLLELLRSPEDRVRYRARIELSGRDTDEVLTRAREWVATLDSEDPELEHHLLEALWLYQQHDRMDRPLLERLLRATDARARAAATRVVRNGRHHLPDGLALLAPRAVDEHARVRLEAVVAASFFESAQAAEVALSALSLETDNFLDYALGETIRALEPHWRGALRAGESLSADNPAGVEYLLERVDDEELLMLPRMAPVHWAILTRHGIEPDLRRDAAGALAHETNTSRGSVVLEALARVDRDGGTHAGHVTHELGMLLRVLIEDGGAPERSELERFAGHARRADARGVAYAGMVMLDDSIDLAWSSAIASRSGLAGMLEAIPMLLSWHDVRDFQGRVRPLMFALPPHLMGDGQGAAAGSGVEVSVFEPPPPSARREDFEQATPTRTTWAGDFTLDLPGVRDLPRFGLTFRGLIHVPQTGQYTFETVSDDGSRLYVDGRCVVDNDGDHSLGAVAGQVKLTEGPHTILVTFFESGGDEGLAVFWDGPGFERQPIPASVLSSGGESALRAAAVRAVAALPGNVAGKLADAARLVGDALLLESVVDLVRTLPEAERTPSSVRPLLDNLTAYLSGLGVESRTMPDVLAALDLARGLARSLPEEEARPALAALEGLGGTVVLLRTLPHQMLYDLSEFWVEAGSTVSIVFQNNDVMPHNLVVTMPGTMEEVGRAAELLPTGAGSQSASFIPDSESVLWHTRLVYPGESQRLTFTAPSVPGDHPYVCTYPGHWRVMNGVMHVVKDFDGETRLTRREGEGAPAPARTFVRDWALADLERHFQANWRDLCSLENGQTLFTEAGCIKCHSSAGETLIGGPDLAGIGEKYRGSELLRHVLEPSLEVLEDYLFTSFELQSGATVTGRIMDEDEESLHIVERLLQPEEVTRVRKVDISDRWASNLSPMPSGLLVTLDESEIVDLIGYVQEVASAQAPVVAPVHEVPDENWLVYEGGDGPGAGKHIVLLAGDEEYRSEEAMPMLARILAEHHGFRCTVLFSTDPLTGEIDPEEQTHIPGMHLLDDADMVICFLRFRELPDADMAHFVQYVESGKPIFGVRTATHAFAYGRDPASPYLHYRYNASDWPGGFGQQILGDTWIAHHGKHGSESTRGVIEPGNEEHPILRGVDDVWGPTDVYAVRNLGPDATVLLRGQVLAGMQPESQALDGPKNAPMMPIVWARELGRDAGAPQRVICSTIGASVDLESEDLRRVFVNACYWGMGLEDRIPPASKVDIVGDYEPTPFGFGKYVRGLHPADYALE
ncbi:MAG: putative heme-binding domain-containing protein [Chlamydiales bacterium]|jgi:putative heme-binding domain-containing protein